jgi:hypothetical protein
MSNKKLIRENWVIDQDLKDILVFPELLSRTDLVTKKEMLMRIKNRKVESFIFINDFMFNNPGYTFEFCSNNISQMFTYNELQFLENLVSQSIDAKIIKDEYEKLFFSPGLKLFDYLNTEFNKEKAPTTKYTIIFHFLNNNKLLACSRKEYLKFVKEYCILKIKFSRLDFLEYTNEKFIKNEQELTQLYHDFLKLNTIE